MDDLLIRMMQLGREGYSCSQIILLLGLEARGERNPDRFRSLVRAMAGLAYGCGSGRASCGALTGGCCLLALNTAKGDDDETPSDRYPVMQQELADWFSEHVGEPSGGIACVDIVGEAGPAASGQRCSNIVLETYTKVMDILVRHNIDPMGM